MTVRQTQPALAPSPARGLTTAQAGERRREGLGNDYTPPTSRPLSLILRTNVFTRFNALLGSLLVVILIVGPMQDALFGLALLGNTLVGIVQELRAKRALDRLALVTAPRATVVRDGEPVSVPAEDVVVGDLVELTSGDQVVVDGDIVESRSLQVDESLLTGESDAVEKAQGGQVLSGSFVVGGWASYVVTAVGEQSYAAGLSQSAREFSLATSELRDGINGILRAITWVLVPTAVLLFWSQLSRANNLADALRASVAGTVTMVPEGLILLTSVAFAVGALRLARRRVLARELASIEGLARVDTLCIDKTGTLTSGRLQLSRVVPLSDTGELDAALGALARLEPHPNATAAALAEAYPAVDWVADESFPFTSANKWSGADFAGHGQWLLGAPDVLTSDPQVRRLTDELAADGARVLLAARAGGSHGGGTGERQAVALLALRDQIRPDAATTLAYLRGQGVTVRVISGDHPETVGRIAREVGLDVGTPTDARKLDVDDPAAASVIDATSVFGRVTPEQKQGIVRSLQSRGHVVAMTGDGVNDVLALKAADVGIAMGAGSAATRAVAQLVLLDSAFTAVPAIIGEGRRVIANMERVANLFLTKTVYATVLAITVGIARLPFPFLPRHLTLVSTLTIGIPAFVLALARNSRRARPHFVARVARFAIPTGVVAAAATYLTYLAAREQPGTSLQQARTTCTIALSAIALWVLAIIARQGKERSAWLVPTMAAAFVVVLAVPGFRRFFALSLPGLLLLLAAVGAVTLAGFAMESGWRLAGWAKARTK
ncbi:MAG TPA: HAD-IC family P-type ATPase [Mycobacteriales bacterium]|jgi:cation-transporting ATPase E|nr:HAD-IC family P-type ATPase [Mycobacteriales bacterium]